MGRKSQCSKELKISIVQRYLNREGSTRKIGENGINKDVYRNYIFKFYWYELVYFQPSNVSMNYY